MIIKIRAFFNLGDEKELVKIEKLVDKNDNKIAFFKPFHEKKIEDKIKNIIIEDNDYFKKESFIDVFDMICQASVERKNEPYYFVILVKDKKNNNKEEIQTHKAEVY